MRRLHRSLSPPLRLLFLGRRFRWPHFLQFNKKRIEEDLEVARRKVVHLRLKTEGNSMVERLQQELREYREILKCSICLDRPKEVVITKCYHLFCNPCVQKITESRHRKCQVCAASFGANGVKPVYI